MIMYNNLLFIFWIFLIVSLFRPQRNQFPRHCDTKKRGDTGNFQNSIRFLFGTLKCMTFLYVPEEKVTKMCLLASLSLYFKQKF
jgi:hypothetical protein